MILSHHEAPGTQTQVFYKGDKCSSPPSYLSITSFHIFLNVASFWYPHLHYDQVRCFTSGIVDYTTQHRCERGCTLLFALVLELQPTWVRFFFWRWENVGRGSGTPDSDHYRSPKPATSQPDSHVQTQRSSTLVHCSGIFNNMQCKGGRACFVVQGDISQYWWWAGQRRPIICLKSGSNKGLEVSPGHQTSRQSPWVTSCSKVHHIKAPKASKIAVLPGDQVAQHKSLQKILHIPATIATKLWMNSLFIKLQTR